MPLSQNAETTEANPASACDRRQKRARRKQLNPRSPTSCEPCRTSKLRCDRQLPCGVCTRRGNTSQCRYSSSGRKSSVSHNATTVSTSKQHGDHPTPHTSTENVARPTDVSGSAGSRVGSDGEDYTQARWDALWQRPARDEDKVTTRSEPSSPFGSTSSRSAEELVLLLPPAEYCDCLIIQYFTYIAPMFNVLDDHSFQRRYNAFDRNSRIVDLSWVALIFSISSLAIQTLEDNDPVLEKVKEHISCTGSTSHPAKEFRKLAVACLYADNFMFHFNLVTLESVLILTYSICHGSGVDAAWTLLGIHASSQKYTKFSQQQSS